MDTAEQEKCKENVRCGYEDPAAVARAAIVSVQTSAVSTAGAGLVAAPSSASSVGVAAGLAVGVQ